jgi:TonB family protein
MQNPQRKEDAMKAYAESYGSLELQHVAHRYWLWGFGLSLIMHAAVLGIFHLPGFNGISTPVLPLHTPIICGDPNIDWVCPTLPTLPSLPGKSTPGKLGTFVPVPNQVEGTTDRLPTNPGLEGVGEGGSGSTGGLPGGEGTAPDGVVIEEPPLPYVAVENEPVIIQRVNPVYPELAVKAGVTGRVWAKLWVDRAGKVRQVVILKSSNTIFDDAVKDAAAKWLFIPAVMNNGPVSVWVAVPFEFALK